MHLNKNSSILSEIKYYVKKNRKSILGINLLTPLSSLLNIGLLYFLKRVFDDYIIISKNEQAYQWIFLLLALFLLLSLVEILQTYLSVKTFTSIAKNLKMRLYNVILESNIISISQKNYGEIGSYFRVDINSFVNLINIFVCGLFKEILTIIPIIIFIFYLNPLFAIVCICVYLLLIFPTIKAGQKIRTISHDLLRNSERSEQLLHDSIYGHMIIYVFRLKNYFINKYNMFNDDLAKNVIKSSLLGKLIQPLNDISFILSMLILSVIGISQIKTGKMSIGDFVIFLTSLYKLSGPIKGMFGIYASFQSSIISSERLVNLLNEPSPRAKEDTITLPGFNHSIVLDRVSFSYHSKKRVLNEITMEIRKGERIVVLGKTGAGKSTILSLLLRIIIPDSGTIKIDGQDYQSLDIDSMLNLVGYVSQEPILFNDSIEHNIKLGKLNASALELAESCRIVNLEKIIENLPLGIKTFVGEKGRNISGGEKQKITIARALVRQPEIIVFDEATSSIDFESDELLRTEIFNVFLGKTIILITHRPIRNSDFDKVFTLENGILKMIYNRK